MNEKPYCGKANMADDYTIMYFRIRQGIGVLGMLLPFLCPLAVLLFGKSGVWQPTISHYYFSVAHIAFVGILVVIGALLVAYRGRSSRENWLSNFLGLLAFLVAIFPTTTTEFIEQDQLYISVNSYPTGTSTVHNSSAAMLLFGFAIYCLSFFQCQDPKVERAPADKPAKKKFRNRLYKICGWAIIISLALAAYYHNFGNNRN